jgi:quercetin dioxygenase-like cupin family protein
MRITRFAALPLLATAAAAVVGCSDGAAAPPTASPRAAAAVRKDGAALTSVVLPPVGGFTSTVLARGSFSDAIDVQFRIKADGRTQVVHVDDPTQMVMAKITIAAGGALPWHTHPGPALVTVAAGELTVVDGDHCEARRYVAGSSFMDSGQGHVHTAYNSGAVEMTLYVTYLDVPVGQSPLVPVQAPGC